VERLRAGRGLVGLSLLSWIVATTLTGCGGNAGEKNDVTKPNEGAGSGGSKPRIVLVTNSNSDYWTAAEKGMKDAGAKLGADVEMKRNEGGVEGQIKLLEDALSTADVKGVAVSVVEPEAAGIIDAMRKLKEAGKAVITVDSDVASSSADVRRAYIGSNNVKAGETLGKAAAQVRPQGGTVLMFVGSMTAANARERRDGFYVGAGPKFINPPLEVFEDGGTDMNRAQSMAADSITKHPDASVLLGLYSYNGPRIALEASKNPDFRKKALIACFDLDEQLIEHLEQGNVDFTVVQNPYEIGYQAIRMLKAMAEDDKKLLGELLPNGKDSYDTGFRVIVPSDASPIKGDNVLTIKAMKEWLATKGLKSS